MSQEDENATATSQTWLGTSYDGLYKGQGPWKFSVPPIIPSKYHHVLFHQPVIPGIEPKPHYNSQPKHWDDDHIRMPYSEKSLFVVKENGEDVIKPRWDVICEALDKPINSSLDFEVAVNAYNTNLREFTALHYFFTEVVDEEEGQFFFTEILPEIIKLALRLPELVPGSIPLLKKSHCKSISLSQMQIACLLANAFLCTFIWRKDLATSYPAINFVRLFTANDREKRRGCVAEKIKCVCHYFRKILKTKPTGVVTFERKFIPRNQIPRWDCADHNLGNTKIHITSTGLIEDAQGLLQVDFANKFLGGGVLGYGCVQEEIRFMICPELIISRLFTQELGDTEAVVIMGVERFSLYSGYGDTFKWEGNFDDCTPFDDFGRRRTSLAVIDAIKFNRPKDQFNPSAILRELNKAYVGFSCREKSGLSPVASGNWGCGAFKGDPHLKSLIQLMACTGANRDLVYYSFGNEELRNDFYNMHVFLATQKISICQLWRYLCQFCIANLPSDKLYAFIQQAHFDSKTQPTLKQFISLNQIQNQKKKSPIKIKEKDKSPVKIKEKDKSPVKVANNNEELLIGLSSIMMSPESPDIFENDAENGAATSTSSEKSGTSKIPVDAKADKSLTSADIISVMDLIDGGDTNRNSREAEEPPGSFLSKIDGMKKAPKETVIVITEDNGMETDDLVDEFDPTPISTFLGQKKRKITDYFTKNSKNS